MSRERIIKALDLEKAIKEGRESFVLLKEIEEVREKVENIKPTDTSDLKEQLNVIEQKLNEPIEVELEIE
jgi:hypothetical protein